MECLKPTPWESRNLGIECFMVSPDFIAGPDEKKLTEEIDHVKSRGKIFIYARVAKKDFSINPMLEKLGFYFVEQTVEPYTILSKNQALQQFLSNKDDFVPRRYAGADLEVVRLDKDDKRLCAQVFDVARESFSDDRFHLDPKCAKQTADQRFVYWVRDLLVNPEVIFYIVRHKEDIAGFMAWNGEYLVLVGLSREYQGSGLGGYLWLSSLEDLQARGIDQVHTLISVNNISALNLYARLGFKFRNPCVTFHYWG